MTMIKEQLSDDVTLYCADCMDVLPTLEAGSVDAVITDPPYGIGFKYNSHDDKEDGYGEWLWNIIEISESKCKPGSPIFVFQAMSNVRKFTEWFPRDWRIFAACKNFVQMRPTAMQYSYDPVITWWTVGDKWYEGTASRDYFVANTSPSSRTGLNDASGHPCPRPLDQMRLFVEQWARPSGTVFDPFMGSGTTGVAAVQLGRKFIGIEIDETYYEIAKKRIQQAMLQIRMEI